MWYRIAVDGHVSKLSGTPSLQQMQEAVGGFVERVQMDGRTFLWVNEEGKLDGLPVNQTATGIWELFYGQTDVIVGSVLLEVWGKTKKNEQIVLEDVHYDAN